MKRILLSLAIISIVAAGAIGATRAYFSDTETISGNTFTSGTMALKIDQDPNSAVQWWTDGFTNPYNPFANVKPGDIGHQVLDIKNVGSVNGNVTIKFDVTSWSALADNLNFVVTYDSNNDGVFETSVASGLLNVWNHNTYPLGALNANQIGSVRIDWSVPTTAGNDIQGTSVTLDTTFGLEQVH
jgi:predicted ribosomally synthesized peptide with SipW-like signal peptide